MKKYLIVGLTSSCTKIVSRMVAMNLGMIDDIDGWDGRNDIESEDFLVSHRSLPHFHRSMPNRWIDTDFVAQYDIVIVVTRDVNCSMISSVRDHQPNKQLAKEENERGKQILKDILDSRDDVYVFSCETAQILQEHYTVPFLKKIGVDLPQHTYFKNINKKYVGGAI